MGNQQSQNQNKNNNKSKLHQKDCQFQHSTVKQPQHKHCSALSSGPKWKHQKNL